MDDTSNGNDKKDKYKEILKNIPGKFLYLYI